MMLFTISSLLLVLAATGEPLFRVGGYDKEYREYCCDQFDRTDGRANHRVLEDCENQGAMPACFCGLLQDLEFTTSSASSSNPLLMSSPRGKGDDGMTRSSAGTQCVGGKAGGVYPCKDVALMSFIPKSRFNLDQNSLEDTNDIWGWSYNDGGTVREFALIGLTDGVGLVEITDPTNPIVLGRLESKIGTSLWRDIKVYNGYAFVVSESIDHGMQVFNLKRLLTASNSTFAYFDPDKTFGNLRAHNIVINEDTGYAYLVGARIANGQVCGGGLYMVDISNPMFPFAMGCATDTSYTHDAHCVIYNGPDTAHVGKEICFLCNTDHVAIVDVSNKANPVIISEKSYRDYQYTHQGWLSPDHSYFVFGDELDETREGIDTTILVMNVTDLDNPTAPGRYVATGRSAVDHNLYIQNFGAPKLSTDIIYLANYRAGLRILKVNDYAAVGPSDSTDGFEEIAYFDTYPSNDGAGYNGAWSVFPYFESGTVIISSIEEGLFIVRPDLSAHLPQTSSPSAQPSKAPSPAPSPSPSSGPSSEPSMSPTATPSSSPSLSPSSSPSLSPSSEPSLQPSSAPSTTPSAPPSVTPSAHPSWIPSSAPSSLPSTTPTLISSGPLARPTLHVLVFLTHFTLSLQLFLT
jgi:choice-of-anchor B domain-containing protein